MILNLTSTNQEKEHYVTTKDVAKGQADFASIAINIIAYTVFQSCILKDQEHNDMMLKNE